jgi:alginate O-acetyltransferase complex protein AlgI
MVFASIIFLFYFLPAVLLGYFLLPARPAVRNLFLFLVSLVFYMSGEAWFVLLMLGSALVDYVCGGVIEREFEKAGLPLDRRAGVRRTGLQRAALWTSLLFNLGALGFFKYFYFTLDNYNALCSLLGLESLTWSATLRITLPLGISFYTFQTLSYTLDVYRGHVQGTRRFVDFGCFVTMFPQLIAGPIVRYSQVEKELRKRTVTIAMFAEGAALFIVGLGKKVIFANILAEPTDRIFAIPHDQLPAGVAWIGAVFFTLQLFFDFAGYSDMARGMGRMFGFDFPINFNYPYISRTVAEAWTRWHIT